MNRPVAILAALLLLATGCSDDAPPQPVVPVRSEATHHGIRLEVETPRSTVRAGEEIVVRTSVTNDRPEAVTIWSSGSGPVAFGIRRLEDGLAAEADWTSDCAPHDLPSGEPVSYAFHKSAAWSEKDPDAPFLKAYAADPLLRLPPGRWRIEARFHGVIGECGGPLIELVAELEILVIE